jgi:hypothetical protein
MLYQTQNSLTDHRITFKSIEFEVKSRSLRIQYISEYGVHLFIICLLSPFFRYRFSLFDPCFVSRTGLNASGKSTRFSGRPSRLSMRDFRHAFPPIRVPPFPFLFLNLQIRQFDYFALCTMHLHNAGSGYAICRSYYDSDHAWLWL